MENQDKSLIVSQSLPEVVFTKKEPDSHCNGKIHRQNKYCKKSAGYGTEHVGEGRCKLHGGCSTGPKSGQLRYSDFVPTSIVEKYEEFASESDEEIKSLDDEIALLRAKITSVESVNNSGNYDRIVVQMAELVRRLVETKQKVEEGIKTKVSIEIVFKFVDLFVKIVDKYVDDVNIKKNIAGEIRRINLSQLDLN